METKIESLSSKLIIYDSNCKLCTAMKNLLITLAPFIKNQVVAYNDLDDSLINKVDHDKFRNEMALIDKGPIPTKYGAEGVGFIFSRRSRFFNWLFSSKLFKHLFVFLYKVLATNRYIIALPKSTFNCNCFPDKILKYRIAYILITFTISIILTALFGISLKAFFIRMTSLTAAGEMLLMAGTGWVLQIIVVLIFLKGKALDYIGHLGSIMVVGLLVLVPSMLIQFIFLISLFWIPLINVLISSALMLYLHIYRVQRLELSAALNVSWFLFLQSTALLWIYIFHLNA